MYLLFFVEDFNISHKKIEKISKMNTALNEQFKTKDLRDVLTIYSISNVLYLNRAHRR